MKLLVLFVLAALARNAQDFTRGVGVYPGKQEQCRVMRCVGRDRSAALRLGGQML
jgi:hypothetical protein